MLLAAMATRRRGCTPEKSGAPGRTIAATDADTIVVPDCPAASSDDIHGVDERFALASIAAFSMRLTLANSRAA